MRAYSSRWIFLELAVPAYRSVVIGLDVRPLLTVEDGFDYRIEKADILSLAIQNRACSKQATIINRNVRNNLFMNEIAILEKFQLFQGIPVVCDKEYITSF
jgi:hypothetical protein